MNRKADFYRRCHKDLDELSDKRQLPLFNIDNEVKNRLILDETIRLNGLYCAITPKGVELFLNKHYLELAEKAECKERERQLRERDSFANQRLVEETIKQTKIGWDNRNTQQLILVISGISLIVSILSFVYSCNR